MDMNKWLYRAVGVASGALMLGGGVAHAGSVNEADRTVDPQAMRGLLADLFTPTGGQHHLGLQIDIPGTFPQSRVAKDTFVAGTMPDLAKVGIAPESTRQPELLPGLGLTSGAGGNGGLLGGLTGAAGGGSGLVGGLTGGLTGGGGSGLLGGLTGGLTGGGGAGLLGGLTGGDSGGLLGGLTKGGGPLGGLTGGLTGGDGPLGGLTGGLTGGDGPLGSLTAPLTSGLANSGGPLSGIGGMLGGGEDNDDLGLSDLPVSDLGTPGPLSTDIVDPALRGTALDTADQRPVQLHPDIARQVNDATSPMVSALIADAVASQFGSPDLMPDPNDESLTHEEALPIVGGLPVVGDLLGPAGPLSQFLVVGDIFDKLPVVGSLTSDGGLDLAALDKLPVVSKVLSQGLLQSDGPSLPVVGSIPFLGKLTDPLTGGGQGASPLNALGALTSPLGALTGGQGAGPLGALTGAPAPAPVSGAPRAVAQPVAVNQPQAPARAGIQRPAQEPTVGKHRAPTDTVRPMVNDPEYAEESLPLLGALTGGGGLPLSTLVRQLPLASELPLVGQLSTPMQVLKSLPLVGGVVGILPIESGHAA